MSVVGKRATALTMHEEAFGLIDSRAFQGLMHIRPM